MKVKLKTFTKDELVESIIDELKVVGFKQVVGWKTPIPGEFIINGTDEEPVIVAAIIKSPISAYRGISIKILKITRKLSLYFIREDVTGDGNFYVGNDSIDFRKDFHEVLTLVDWRDEKVNLGESRKRFVETVEDTEKAYKQEVLEAFCNDTKLYNPDSKNIINVEEDEGDIWYITCIDPVTRKEKVYYYDYATGECQV